MTLIRPAYEIDIEIQKNIFKVKYPNTGDVIEIATLKSKLSDNQYSSLIFQRSNESTLAVKLIDTYCFFQIMLPELKKTLSVKSLFDLETIDSVELIHVYENIVSPWLDQWTEVINQKIDELAETTDKDSKRSLV